MRDTQVQSALIILELTIKFNCLHRVYSDGVEIKPFWAENQDLIEN